jgi:hypothetical protein
MIAVHGFRPPGNSRKPGLLPEPLRCGCRRVGATPGAVRMPAPDAGAQALIDQST